MLFSISLNGNPCCFPSYGEQEPENSPLDPKTVVGEQSPLPTYPNVGPMTNPVTPLGASDVHDPTTRYIVEFGPKYRGDSRHRTHIQQELGSDRFALKTVLA